jgi:hypothetical protein
MKYFHAKTGFGLVRVWFFRLGGLLSLLIGVGILAFAVVAQLNAGLMALPGLCIAWYLFCIPTIIGLILFNFYPSLYLSDEGISISFMLGQIFVPWSSVISVKTSRLGIHHTGVLAQRISLLHYAYGVLFLHTVHPAFLIDPALSDRIALIESIEEHIKVQPTDDRDGGAGWKSSSRLAVVANGFVLALGGVLLFLCFGSLALGATFTEVTPIPTPAPALTTITWSEVCPECNSSEFWLDKGDVTFHIISKGQRRFHARLSSTNSRFGIADLVDVVGPYDGFVRVSNLDRGNYYIRIDAEGRFEWTITIERP